MVLKLPGHTDVDHERKLSNTFSRNIFLIN